MVNLFEECLNEQWRDFLNFHSKICEFDKDDYIFKSGQNVLGLYLIKSGKVKITLNRGAKEEERIIRLASAGDVAGHRGFGQDWRYPVSAICYESTTLLFYPLKVLNTALELNPKFSYQLMIFFAEELKESEMFRELISVKSRIAWVLLKNYKVFGHNQAALNFTLPRKDMASFAATTYETTVRTLRELKKDGIIEIHNKDIAILDAPALQELAGGGL